MAVDSAGSGSAATLHYAFGGGLGHLTRTVALRHTLGLEPPSATLCASPFAESQRFAAALNPCMAPAGLDQSRDALREWIAAQLAKFRPLAFYVDVFPGGILGELCDFPWPEGMELILVARILKWKGYSETLPGSLPRFDRILMTETLPADQVRWLETLSESLAPIHLKDPPADAAAFDLAGIRRRWSEDGRPVWLIVHSGPDAETHELIAYARECASSEGKRPFFVVVSPERPHGLDGDGNGDGGMAYLKMQPAHPLFAFADRIFTGGGFNAMRETGPWHAKHKPLPFPRRFDDQFLRIARSRSRGSP